MGVNYIGDLERLKKTMELAAQTGIPDPVADAALARVEERGADYARAAKGLEHIRDKMKDCTRCSLADYRNHIVFGEGNPGARIMFVGEVPGAQENNAGAPFVGRSGQFLNKFLEKAGISREDVYVANIIKCHPPQNRDPTADEVTTCSSFLRGQIFMVKPKVIVTLGRFAANHLSGNSGKALGSLRKRSDLVYTGPKGAMIPIVPAYHPAYILRQLQGRHNENGKIKARGFFEDIQKAIALSAGSEQTVFKTSGSIVMPAAELVILRCIECNIGFHLPADYVVITCPGCEKTARLSDVWLRSKHPRTGRQDEAESIVDSLSDGE